MPEFEENNSQTNSTYSYTPGTGTSKNKGGRRRSSGFKSEATTSTSKIGEVDPVEALKSEKAPNNNSQSNEVPEKPETCLVKSSKASSAECAPDKTPKPKGSKAQPSKATLDSIKSVEEKIARRLAEDKKNRPAKTGNASKKNKASAYEKNKSSNNGGLLAAISRFFGKLLGSSPKNQPTDARTRTPQKHRSESQHKNNRRGPRKNGSSGTRQKNSRGVPKNRRSNKPRNT